MIKKSSKNLEAIRAERKANDARRARQRRAEHKAQAAKVKGTLAPTSPRNQALGTLHGRVGVPYNTPMKPGTLDHLKQSATHPGPAALFPDQQAPAAPATGTKFLTPDGLMGLFKAVHSIPLEALPPVIREALEDAKASALSEPPNSHGTSFTATKEYTSLFKVLVEAYEQAAVGKGAERHANALPYESQPMQVISGLLHSSEGLSWQAIKKVQEAHGILSKAVRAGDPEAVKAAKAFHRKEMLGAINYLAGALIFESNQ